MEVINVNEEATWRDIKMYGKGVLGGMALFWGVMQYHTYKTIQENKFPTINWECNNKKETKKTKINNFGIEFKSTYKWNPKKQKRDVGEEMTVYNLKDKNIVIKADYFDSNVKTIDIKNIGNSKIINTQKIDLLYRISKEKVRRESWFENYKQHIKNYRNTHGIRCDTLIRNKWGDEFNVSDLTGDGNYDRILYVGRHPGEVMDLRLQRDSAEFYQTLNKLMNQN